MSSTYDLTLIIKEGSVMPRKGNVPKREVLPDPMYGSNKVNKQFNV